MVHHSIISTLCPTNFRSETSPFSISILATILTIILSYSQATLIPPCIASLPCYELPTAAHVYARKGERKLNLISIPTSANLATMRLFALLAPLLGLALAQDPPQELPEGTHSEIFDAQKYSLNPQLLLTPINHPDHFIVHLPPHHHPPARYLQNPHLTFWI